MKKTMLVCSLVLLAIPVLAPAKDFPLEFKTLNTEQVKGYRWSYGAIKMIVAAKPAALQKEPKAMSAHPLYGVFEWRADKTSMLFRLDESKGDGKGYDRLILDLNQNGDLTDDAAISPAAGIGSWSNYAGQELTLFGPIEAPASKRLGSGKPIYYAILDVRSNAVVKLRKNPAAATNVYLGNLRLRAGWYLETTVEMDGVKQKMAAIDNDANMRLGDLCQPFITPDGRWFLGAADGDRLLLDKDGSGTNNVSQCFAQILYFDATPYKAALAADCSSLQIEPWPEPLAEVSLQPHGEQVRGLGLGWESAKGQWQFIDVGVAGGKIKVPPGNYGLWAISLSAKTQKAEEITAGGINMNSKKIFSAAAGVTNTLLCGAPLEIKVTTELTGGRAGSSPGGFWSSLQSWIGKLFSSEADELQIQAEIVGSGGETYSSFFLKEDKGKLCQPPKPIFTVATTDGKEVASGNMEFG
jgi:hypothetical protein